MSNTTQRLGKGLEALIPKTYFASGKTISSIPLNEIEVNPFQPREFFKEEALQALADSIKTYGVAQPIIVRRMGNHYEIIAGERRFRAAKLAGIDSIPAIIRSMTDKESLQLALVENLFREDLNSIEVAKGYQQLQDEFKLTHQELSDIFGKSRSSITNTLRLLGLPVVIQQAIVNGEITEGHARTLIGLKTEAEMIEFLTMIKDKGLSVRDIEKIISEKGAASEEAVIQTIPRAIELMPQLLESLANELTSLYHLPVKIQGRQNKGKIEIKYRSEEELNHIYFLLTGKKGETNSISTI